MTINPKLEDLPPIYYFNLEHRVDRREYIEKQFSEYGITNYQRVNSSRYSVNNYKEWKSKVLTDKLRTKVSYKQLTINMIKILNKL